MVPNDPIHNPKSLGRTKAKNCPFQYFAHSEFTHKQELEEQ